MPNSPDAVAESRVDAARAGLDAQCDPSSLLDSPLPSASDDAVKFAQPWEAKAFALVVSLAGAGRFTWSEWVDCFSREVAAATAALASGGMPKSYYEQWLDAAEALLVAKGVTSREQLTARRFAIGSVGSTHLMR